MPDDGWPYPYSRPGDDKEYCDVFRSHLDPKVWMCNIPYVDVTDGLTASTSLRKVKAYVEEVAGRQSDYGDGTWKRTEDGDWQYWPEEAGVRH